MISFTSISGFAVSTSLTITLNRVVVSVIIDWKDAELNALFGLRTFHSYSEAATFVASFLDAN